MSESIQGVSSGAVPGDATMDRARQALFDALAQSGNGNLDQGMVQHLLEATAGLSSDEQQLADEADKSLAAALNSVIAEMSTLEGEQHEQSTETPEDLQQHNHADSNDHTPGAPEPSHDNEDLQLFQQIQNHLSLLPESSGHEETTNVASDADHAAPNDQMRPAQDRKDMSTDDSRIEVHSPSLPSSQASSSAVLDSRQDLNIEPSVMNLLGEGSDLDTLAMTDLTGCSNASMISVVMLARQASSQANDSYPGPKTLDELASTLDSGTIDQVGQVLNTLMSSLGVARSDASSPSPSNETRQSSTTPSKNRRQQDHNRQRHRNNHHISIRKMAVHQQLRIRLENRERKKKWRSTNSDRNKDNDLRSRVIKRASVLYKNADSESPERQRWIDEEFRRRKQKRLDRERNERGNKKIQPRPNDEVSDEATRLENAADGMAAILTALTSPSISTEQLDSLLKILSNNSDLLHALLELLAGPESSQLGVSESVAHALIQGIASLQARGDGKGSNSNKRPPPQRRKGSTSSSSNNDTSKYARLMENRRNPSLSLSSLAPYRDDDNCQETTPTTLLAPEDDAHSDNIPRPLPFVALSEKSSTKHATSSSVSLPLPTGNTCEPPPWDFGFPPSNLEFSLSNNNNNHNNR